MAAIARSIAEPWDVSRPISDVCAPTTPEAFHAPRRYSGDTCTEFLRVSLGADDATATAHTEKTDEQKAICEMVHQFADEQIIPNAEHYDHEDAFPEPIVEQMKELGLFGVTIPEEYGGMGLDLTTYAMIVEELSRGWISISGIVNTHFIGSYLLMKFGTDEQKQKYLPKMATGEIRAAFSPVRARVRLRRRRRSRPPPRRSTTAHYEINGQKMWVTNGLLSEPRVRARQDRPERRAQVQGHDLLHRREGAGRQREHRRVQGLQRPAEDQEDGLQGRRVDRARVRRLPLPGREHPRRRGGRPQQGLRADDGRARGRPRQRRRPRRRHRPARARARAQVLPGAQDVRQADRPAPGDPVQARRHGHPGRGRAAAHPAAPRG